MLTQKKQPTVLEELLAIREELSPTASPATSLAPAPSRPATLAPPAKWPRLVALGAASSHLLLPLSLLLMFTVRPESIGEALLLGSACLAPLAALCSLLAILLVWLHVSGWILLVGILTMPLNVYICLILCGIIPFGC
jgi:hypothetical protein